MYPASPALDYQLSQRWINQVVNIAAQRIGIHPREMLATPNKFGRTDAGMRQRAQFGHWGAVASDDDPLAALDAAQYFSPAVAQFAHRHRFHGVSVSPVIHVA